MTRVSAQLFDAVVVAALVTKLDSAQPKRQLARTAAILEDIAPREALGEQLRGRAMAMVEPGPKGARVGDRLQIVLLGDGQADGSAAPGQPGAGLEGDAWGSFSMLLRHEESSGRAQQRQRTPRNAGALLFHLSLPSLCPPESVTVRVFPIGPNLPLSITVGGA
jgi:hypothetical protein